MQENLTGVIYGICDPNTPDRVRYVGQTARAATQRLKAHIKNARNPQNRLRVLCWIRRLLAAGQLPIVIVLEQTEVSHLDTREIYWIARLKTEGQVLLNSTIGGKAPRGYRHSNETRSTLSDRHRGRPKTAEWKRNISHALRHTTKRENLRTASHRIQSIEEREKRSVALKRWWADPSRREKARERAKGNRGNTGRTFTPEHRAKISAARKRYWAAMREVA